MSDRSSITCDHPRGMLLFPEECYGHMNRNRNPARWLSLGALLLGALSRLPAAEVEAEAGSAGAVTTLFA